VSLPSRTELQADFAAVRRVLMDAWDPVDCGGLPADEYDSYVWPVVRLLRERATDDELARHFVKLERDYFCRDASSPHMQAVIKALRTLDIANAGVRT
jgi:hypothetical protein